MRGVAMVVWRWDSNAGTMSCKLARPRGGAQPEVSDDEPRGAGEKRTRGPTVSVTTRKECHEYLIYGK